MEIEEYVESVEFQNLLYEGFRIVERNDVETYGKEKINNNPYYEPSYKSALEIIKEKIPFSKEEIEECISELWDDSGEDTRL